MFARITFFLLFLQFHGTWTTPSLSMDASIIFPLHKNVVSHEGDDFFQGKTTLEKISDLKDHLQAGDVLLLDIDDTILNHKKVLFWKAVHAIEPNISRTIRVLQKKGVIVLCLTARSLERAKKTQKQLKKIGIDLLHTIQVDKIHHFPFKNGVIYASPTHGEKSIKGPVLKEFLDFFRDNALPTDHKVISKNYFAITNIKRIIFVDDKLSNIESFNSTFAHDPTYQNIAFHGLHFLPPKEPKGSLEGENSWPHRNR